MQNIKHLKKTIEALRGIERWGSSEMLNRIYRGFQALPEHGTVTENQAWWTVLEVDPFAPVEEIKRAYKSQSKIHHPDLGGSHEVMIRLNQAYQQAKDAMKFQ